MKEIHEIAGWASLILILVAASIHVRRVQSGEITLHPVSWGIWTANAVAVLLSYIGANEEQSYLSFLGVIGNFVYPTLGFIFAWKQRKNTTITITLFDKFCMVLGFAAIAIWSMNHESHYANYIAIVADCMATVPTILFVWRNPMQEKPLPWLLFAIGFALTLLTLEAYTLQAMALPIYMAISAIAVAVIQIWHRKKNNIKQSWY